MREKKKDARKHAMEQKSEQMEQMEQIQGTNIRIRRRKTPGSQWYQKLHKIRPNKLTMMKNPNLKKMKIKKKIPAPTRDRKRRFEGESTNSRSRAPTWGRGAPFPSRGRQFKAFLSLSLSDKYHTQNSRSNAPTWGRGATFPSRGRQFKTFLSLSLSDKRHTRRGKFRSQLGTDSIDSRARVLTQGREYWLEGESTDLRARVPILGRGHQPETEGRPF